MKNILKEIFIFVLIILAIILVLGVLLYDYIPTSKVVPQTIAYQTPENLKAEIEDENFAFVAVGDLFGQRNGFHGVQMGNVNEDKFCR